MTTNWLEIRLSEFTQGRDNNFNLIRIVAAMAVLITHSFALAIGTSDAEPFRRTLGMTMGSIAVDIFFVTSGFLVTASLMGRQNIVEFFWARTLRIFPALIVMVLLTVLALGPALTSLSLHEYFADSTTYIYLLKCSTVITGVKYNLPGVFEFNPYKGAVNGSLWTMPYEVRMYAILALVWLALTTFVGRQYQQIFRKIILIFAAIAFVALLGRHFYLSDAGNFSRLFFMFFSGAAFFVLKEKIKLHRQLFWIAVVMLLVAPSIDKDIFFVVYMASVSYILFYVAYIPNGIIRKYNKLGDYSYGVYIYAFPVQQTIAALMPGISVTSMIVMSMAATLVLAITSWHLLEHRALGYKRYYVDFTRSLFQQR